MQITPARSYRATLVPAGTAADEVETLAILGKLPTIQVKSGDAEAAGVAAHAVSGMAVHSIDRMDA